MGIVYRLGQCTVLRVIGKDRCKVVNNLATQDLRAIEPGMCKETFVTDPKGKVFGHGLVAAFPDELLLVTVPDQAELLCNHLDRFIIMEDAKIQNISQQYIALLLSDGSKLPERLSALVQTESCAFIDIASQAGRLLHAPWIGTRSALLLVDPNSNHDELQAALGLPLVDSSLTNRQEWEAARIDQFWPWFGQDMDSRNLPQELDRNDRAISFTKGCYLGQETIARLDALGQVQKKLVRLEISPGPLPELTNSDQTTLRIGDQELGSIRSAAMRPDGTVVALGYVKRSHFEIGTVLSLGKDRNATILEQRVQ